MDECICAAKLSAVPSPNDDRAARRCCAVLPLVFLNLCLAKPLQASDDALALADIIASWNVSNEELKSLGVVYEQYAEPLRDVQDIRRYTVAEVCSPYLSDRR